MTAPVRTLLVGVDGSADAARALAWAIEVATQRRAPVTVVTVLEEPRAVGPWGVASVATELDDESIATARHQVRSALAQALVGRGDREAPEVQTEVLIGPPAEVLLEATPDDGQLVVGCRGRGGFGRLLLGSVSDAVVHHARTPVTVVRGSVDAGEAPVVVGVDGSEGSRPALRYAAQRARETDRELSVVHAWQPFQAPWPAHEPGIVPPLAEFERQATQRLDDFCADAGAGCRIGYQLVRSHAAEALVDASATAAEVVVGSRGRGGFAGLLLGSTSAQVVRHARCPVTVVPGPAGD